MKPSLHLSKTAQKSNLKKELELFRSEVRHASKALRPPEMERTGCISSEGGGSRVFRIALLVLTTRAGAGNPVTAPPHFASCITNIHISDKFIY
jgi:hypothetical protein